MKVVASIKNFTANPLFRHMAIYAFSDGISKAMPFLVFPIVAYYLTPGEFGLVSNFNVLCQVLFAFTLLNTPTYLTVVYYKTKKEEQSSLVLNIFCLIGILLTISLALTLLLNNVIFKYTELTIKWQLYSLIWVFFNCAIYIYQAKLRLDEKVKQFGAYQFVQSFLSAGFTLLFVVLLKWGWQGRVESLVLTNVSIGGFALFILYHKNIVQAKFDWKQIKQVFLFGIPLLPHTLSFWLKGGLDKIYITNTISIAENGVFSFAGILASIFFMITNAFFSAYTPYLFKTLAATDLIEAESEKERIKIRLLKQVKYFILIYVVANIIGYFAIKLIIQFFFLKNYGAALKFIPWLQLGGFFSIFYAIFSSYVFYTKSTKMLGVITISTALLQALLSYFAVVHYGVMGIIVTGVFINLLMAILVGIQSNKVYQMPWKHLFNPFL